MDALLGQLNLLKSEVIVEGGLDQFIEQYFSRDVAGVLTVFKYISTLDVKSKELQTILNYLTGGNAQSVADACQEWMSSDARAYLLDFPNITDTKYARRYTATKDQQNRQSLKSVAWLAALVYDEVTSNHAGSQSLYNFAKTPVCPLLPAWFYARSSSYRKAEKIIVEKRMLYIWTRAILNRFVTYALQNEPISGKDVDRAVFFKRHVQRLLHISNAMVRYPVFKGFVSAFGWPASILKERGAAHGNPENWKLEIVYFELFQKTENIAKSVEMLLLNSKRNPDKELKPILVKLEERKAFYGNERERYVNIQAPSRSQLIYDAIRLAEKENVEVPSDAYFYLYPNDVYTPPKNF